MASSIDPIGTLVQHFDDYRRLIDDGYKEVQRFLAVGDYALAVEAMQASVSSQTSTLTNLRQTINK